MSRGLSLLRIGPLSLSYLIYFSVRFITKASTPYVDAWRCIELIINGHNQCCSSCIVNRDKRLTEQTFLKVFLSRHTTSFCFPGSGRVSVFLVLLNVLGNVIGTQDKKTFHLGAYCPLGLYTYFSRHPPDVSIGGGLYSEVLKRTSLNRFPVLAQEGPGPCVEA